MSEGWEPWAEQWIAWARTPGHDSYWRFRDRFFDLLPASGRVLDVGCGEGRVTRDLRGRGYDVTGIEASPTLVAAAREAEPAIEYVRGEAETLPFDDRSFDAVVFYNSLMDVADMGASLREAARVLVDGGRVCACVVHPIADVGSWTSRDASGEYVIRRSYLAPFEYTWTLSRGGLTITYTSRHYPLEAYAGAFERAGLPIEALREVDDPRPGDDRWERLPLFLFIRAVKP